ncbi:hypothetical protein N1851_026482 [Merluccius polli]|uniref:Uncharacterized protein n=1 Tax=Merluccius polli TaxID=89951 RepID=A0AA47MBX7_MERPO|nr:hypothetical protein N1851_026482 [Merluccius polli]
MEMQRGHRNLLTQCMFLPVERGSGVTPEESQSDSEALDASLELDPEGEPEGDSTNQCDGVVSGTVSGEEHSLTEQADRGTEDMSEAEETDGTRDCATSTQRTNTLRRNPERKRRPPAKLSFQSQVTTVESVQQTIEREKVVAKSQSTEGGWTPIGPHCIHFDSR